MAVWTTKRNQQHGKEVDMVNTDVRIGQEATQGLRVTLKGDVIEPNDDAYEDARHLWNGMIDKRPAAIVRPRGVADVIEAVNFARANDLPVVARGGGHNVSGNAMSQDGLTIDLSEMNGVRIDPITRTARAEGGARLGDLDRETQVFGLAVPAGVVSDTGVAGLTLGGGVGWMRRKYGVTSDNVVSMDVVTADARLVVANERENPDLFWALRGGGGGFGVVTSFEYRAYPLGPEIFFTAVFHPYSEAKDILKLFREYAESAPDEMNVLAAFGTIPTTEAFPQAIHGEKFVALTR
jgi:FAD/FMN-containing dehydrogenase